MINFDYSIIITDMQQNEKENLKLFGTHVQKKRKEQSGSLNEIAFTRGGVTSATLSRIENGKVDFKFSTLIRLSHTINVPLYELFKDFKYIPFDEDK